jgi:hypothetical protein
MLGPTTDTGRLLKNSKCLKENASVNNYGIGTVTNFYKFIHVSVCQRFRIRIHNSGLSLLEHTRFLVLKFGMVVCRINDMTGNLAKCKQFLPSLQRAGRMQVPGTPILFLLSYFFAGGGGVTFLSLQK